jgi:hypothetical protein
VHGLFLLRMSLGMVLGGGEGAWVLAAVTTQLHVWLTATDEWETVRWRPGS